MIRDDISWVLEPLLELPGVQHAVIATGDGLVEGSSVRLDRATSERVAAMTATLHAAGRAIVSAFGGDPEPRIAQSVVEFGGGYVVLVPAGEHASLALLASADAELGNIAYQMQVQVAALARAMDVPTRDAEAVGQS